MGSLPRGNIHVLVNAAKLSSGTTVNLMKQIKKYFKILYSLRDVNIKFIFMSYFGKKGQSDAMKIMSYFGKIGENGIETCKISCMK